MKRTILALAITLLCGLTAYSQRAETRASGQSNNEISATANKAGRNIDLKSGTRLAAELQNTVDVRKARVGDEVVLKTTQAIKSEGRTVVGRGARLIGHVSEVEQKTKANGQSRVGLIFDRLEKGSLQFPIAATITSITSGRTTTRAGDDDQFGSEASSTTSASARSSASQSSSGGLLGGVTSTVGGVTNTAGGVVNSTTNAVGTTVTSTTNSVGGTTAGVDRSLGRIQISQSSSTSAEGGAVFSLEGQNLRLEKGITLNLMLTQSANVATSKEQ
jgi:hypothetical protein